jgi:hypothetical protein
MTVNGSNTCLVVVRTVVVIIICSKPVLIVKLSEMKQIKGFCQVIDVYQAQRPETNGILTQ